MGGSPCADGCPTRNPSPAARWLGVLLTAAVLLAAAPDPASAQSYSGSPKLYRSSLNGATITLTGVYFGDGQAGNKSRYAILGWPSSGAGTLSIGSLSTNSDARTVTLTLAYTGTFVTDQSIRIRLNELVTDAGTHLTLGSIPVFVLDPGLAVGAVARPVAEYGTTVTFTVKLQTQPSAAVTVAVASQDTSEGRVSPASLLFSTSTWNTTQAVTVTGVDDSLTDMDQTWNVRLDPSSSDTAYNGLTNVDVAVTTLDDEGAPVVNSVAITSTPATGDTYVLGETIAVRVGFDRSVTVTGTPQLALTVGSAARQAAYASGTGTAQLTFRYPVQAGDADGNGIAIGAAALTLNGGQIRLTGGTVSARLGLGTSALTDAAGHQVDAVHGPPGVRGVAISPPVAGTAFERGETIAVTVTFNKPVAVTGTPQLALTIGTATRQAAYAADAGTATALTFRYTVVQADADADGLSIGAGALALNGGTIRQAGSPTVNAELGLGFRAIANSAAHRVTGGTFTTPAVTDVRITSTPVFFSSRATINGLAYGRGEVIEFTVTFSRPVTVTGTPIVPIDLPSTDNYASALYVSGTGTRRLVFHYTVAAGHIDDTNVSLQGDTLLLNGGTINDARDSTTAATLTYSVVLRNNVTAQNHDIDADLLPTGIRLSQSTLAVTEGSTGSYTVSLNRAPASDVVVTATRSSTLLGLQRPLDATWAAAATLTFTATTWNTGQMVRVRGEADADAASGRAAITHAVVDAQSANAFDNAPDQVLAVTVTDDEQAAIRVSPSRLEVEEAAEAAYTVRLSHVPTGNVRVLLISSDKAKARVSTTAGGPYAGDWSVRFTPTTWATQQTVYVEARADANRVNENETIRHTVYPQGSADEYAAVTAALPVTILDAASLIVTPRAVTVREGSGTGVPYTVALSEAPSGAVTVTASVAGGSTVVALDADASPQTRVLTFTTATWNTAQTVTVTPTSDADDADTEDAQVMLTHTPAAGSGNAFTYAARPTENVTVTIADDDTPGVVVSATSLTLYEDPSAGGGTNRHVGTYTVGLSSPLGAFEAVGIRITNSDAGAVAVSSPTRPLIGAEEWRLVFIGGAWSTPQTVTVTTQGDADGRDEAVTLSHTIYTGAASAGYPTSLMVDSVTVTVTDDETPALVVDTDPGTSGVQTAALALMEGGGTAAAQAYTVALGIVPTGPVTVSVASGTTSAVTVAPPALTFTTTTWQTAQPVTATAADDADSNHETVTVTHTLTGASEYAGLAAGAVPGVTVTVTDDEAPRAGITAPATLTQAALDTAQVQIALTNAAWTAGVQTSAAVGDYFALDTTVPGLTLEAIASVPSTTTATLDLAYDGTAFDTTRPLRVRVLAAAHTGSENLLTGSVPVTPTPGLTIVPRTGLRTTESGGTATFTVRLATAPTATVVLGLASDNTAEGTVLPTTLTFDAAAWQTAQPVTLTGVDDATATPPNPADGTQSYRITLTVNQAATADAVYDGMAAVTLTAFNQDNEYGLAVGSVTGAATEAGGPAAFTVALQTEPTNTVTVAVASQDPGEGRAAPGQLVFTTTIWETEQTVTVTGQDDPADDGDVVWAVGLTTSSSDTNYDGLTEDVAVTTTDDDDPPGVTLALSAASLTESGAGSTAAVTATLTHPSSSATTVTVTAGAAYTVGPDATILIAAGETSAPTDGAAIIAVANATDEPDRTATVTATLGNARITADGTTMTVTGAALTVRDDDPAPNAALTLTPTSIAENGGLATVTATLDRPSSEPTTVTVTPVPDAYTVGAGAAATIVLAAGATANAADLARITAVDDTIHQGTAGRTATVTATLTNPHGAGTVATGPTLTLTDDETRPTVTLALAPAAIAETGEVATVTATLSGLSGQAVTLTVTTTAVSPAVAGDVTQNGMTLTIAVGTTTSTGLVTLTTVDNSVQTGSKSITVAGAATGGHGVTAPAAATLTLTDDDTPLPTLILTPAAIAENGGTATVTATLNITSTAVVTVTVAAAPDPATGAVAGDFTLSTAKTLTFAAGATTSTGLVTLTAVNNETDAPAKRVTVSGTADDLTGSGLPNDPAAVTLTLTDDDPAPNAALTLNPSTIHEIFASGTTNTAAVQATLDRPSSEPTTVTVTPVAGAYTVRPGTDGFIVIAAGTTATAGAPGIATINAVDDAIHQGTAGRTTTVTAELTNSQGAGTVAGALLTLTDNEPLPTVTLVVTPTAVTEAGGVATVTATLSGLSSQPTTLTVAAAAGTGAVAGDFTLSTATNTVLTIAAGTTTSTGTVTVTAVDNTVDVPDKQVTVTATATGGHGVAAPSAAALTLTDDDVAGLTVDPMTSTTLRLRTSEDGDTATVRVRLATTPTATVVLDLASSATTEGTVAPATLTFTAMTWNTAQPVTLTGVDDAPANTPDGNQAYTVTLTANASSTTDDTYDSVTATVYAVNRDNEFGLAVGGVTGQATEAGGQAAFPVALLTNPGAAVTVAVTSQDQTEGTAAPSVLVFTPDPSGTWQTPQTVTVTGVDDAVDDGDVPWTVRLTTTSSSGNNYHGLDEDVAVTTTDNDDAPTVTLVLTPPAITENGGVATVTATLTYPSVAATTVTVTATADTASGAVAGDFTQTGTELVIEATKTTSTGVVTLTARDNAVDADDKTVTVAGMAANARATTDGMPVSVTEANLTLEDDDERGFAFTPAALVVAAGGTTTYTVALTSKPTAAVTVTLTSDAAVTVAPDRLTFPAMNWNTAQAVTVSVAPGTTAPASLVEHRGMGGDYEGETKTLVVARMAVTGSITPTADREQHYVVNGQPVTMTFAADVPAAVRTGVRIRPPQALTHPLTVTMEWWTDAEAGSGYGLGEPAEQVALDVVVTPPVPARLCLPVPGALWERAARRELVLLRAGVPVEGSEQERDEDETGRFRVVRVCADVPDFSPFAVGYADDQVAFPAGDWDFTFHTGRERSYELPAVETGDAPITYRVTEAADLPPGLDHDTTAAGDKHGGTITGTATAPMAKQAYTLIATDADNQTAKLTFFIDVKPGIERRDLELVLAGIGRTLASDAVEILGSRAGPPPARLHVTLGGQVLRLTDPAQSAPSASAPSPLAGEGRGEGATAPTATPGPSPWQRVTGVAVNVARALGVTLDAPALPPAGAGQSEGSTVPSAQTILDRAPADSRRPASPTWRSPLSIQPVSAKDLLARSAFELPLTRTDADGLPTWTLWGRGAASGFSGQPEDGFKMDGTLYSGYLGLDYRPRSSLLMGLAAAHSTGQVDYERTGGTTAGVDVKLTSLLPYAHWQPYAGLGLWGLLGAGWGEMDLKAIGDPTTYTTALTSWLGAVGGRQALTTWQGIDLAAKTDAFLTTLRSEAKTNLPGARGHAERVRLLLEGQTAVDLSPVSRVQPRLEVGGRWDSGTAEQGLGLELGGGLAYTQTEWGLSVAMQGRYLLVHEDGAFEDWGASVNVRLDPGLGGEGAYLTVVPVWGQPGSGVEQVWGQAAAVPGGTTSTRATGWRPANVEVDVGYGLALADGRGLLTPYGGLVLGDPGTARYRLGSRWAVSTLLDLSVEGERAEQPGQAVTHSVSVRLGWQW